MEEIKYDRSGGPIPPYTHNSNTYRQPTPGICHWCGNKIKVMAFLDQPFCSDKCRKELNLGPKDAYNGRTA